MNPLPLVLQSTLQISAFPEKDLPHLLYLLVEISLPITFPVARSPVNLSLIVDASESMFVPAPSETSLQELSRRNLPAEDIADGVPVYQLRSPPADWADPTKPVTTMDFVRSTIRTFVDHLASQDRFSLIAFAQKAEVLVHNRSGQDKQHLLEALQLLENPCLGQDTWLAAGLQLALQEAQRGESIDRITRLLLLTDGFVDDEQQAQLVARQVAAHGFTLNTAGMGVSFNEGFLMGLAEFSGGNAYLVFHPSEIPAICANELESTQRVLLRTLNLQVTLAPEIELCRVFRVQPMIAEMALHRAQKHNITLELGELVRNESTAVLIELVLPAKPPGCYQIAELVVTGEPPLSTGSRSSVHADVHLDVIPPDQPMPTPDPRVMFWVETVDGFRLQTRVLTASDSMY
jgi:Ca-activated chloride channel family protein